MQQMYFLAVCDILGFSDHVEKNPLDAVVNNSLAWFRRSLNHSMHKSGFPSEVPATADLNRHAHVGVAWFSDTLLFYTKHDSDEAIRELLNTVAWLMFETMVSGHTRVRAGIAYGEAYIDAENSLFVGKPIVEAYQLEQQQQWAGGALTQSACLRIPELARSGRFADWWLVEYDIPLKSGSTLRTLAVNWNQGIHDPFWTMRWSEEFDSPTAEDRERIPSVCEKFANTRRFHETFCHGCRSRAGT